jgi:hypothetical protein
MATRLVILCNGTKEQALEMRQEVANFLRNSLRLTLSMEKTKVVHLNDGFDFLGFHLRRSMGHKGMVTKILISEKAILPIYQQAQHPVLASTEGDVLAAGPLVRTEIQTVYTESAPPVRQPRWSWQPKGEAPEA